MSAPTDIPPVIVDTDAPDEIRHRGGGSLGPFPVVDARGRFWTAESIAAYWHGAAYEAMAKVLRDGGRMPYALDEAWLRLETSLLKVAEGEFVELAVRGGRAGFMEAALGYWRDIATVAGLTSEDPDSVRLDLEGEALAWTAVRGLPLALLDGIAEGLAAGTEERRRSQPKPTGRAGPTRHARRRTSRKEPAA